MTANEIECVSCGKSIYRCRAIGRDFSGDKVQPEDFEPIHSTTPQPKLGDPLQCPLCGDPFFVPQGKAGVVFRLAAGAWWPHPPIDLQDKG